MSGEDNGTHGTKEREWTEVFRAVAQCPACFRLKWADGTWQTTGTRRLVGAAAVTAEDCPTCHRVAAAREAARKRARYGARKNY